MHLVSIAGLVVYLVKVCSLLIEISCLFVVVVLFSFLGAVLCHTARLGHSSDHLVHFDSLSNQLEVLLSVVCFHTEGRLFVIVSLEAIISLTLDTLHKHSYCLVRVSGMFVAVCSLLVKLFSVVFSVLLVSKHVAEKASFECLVCFQAKFRCLDYEIRSSNCLLYH